MGILRYGTTAAPLPIINGRQVELRENEDYIEWRYVGDAEWVQLYNIPLAANETEILDAIEAAEVLAQNAQATADGALATATAKPSEATVRTIAQEEIAGDVLVVEAATGALEWDVSLYDGIRLEMTGDVTLTASNVATLLDLAGVLLLFTGTGTVTFGSGFEALTAGVADASVQEMAFRREGSVLHLMNQPLGTVAGVDDGTASYTASEIAALETRLAAAEAELASGVGTDKISRLALAAGLNLLDHAGLSAELAALTEGVDYTVVTGAPTGAETTPLVISETYA